MTCKTAAKAFAEAVAKPIVIRALLLKERVRHGASFNPLSASLRANPYPSYRRLRTKDPVHWSELLKGWVLTRHADVSFVLRDPRFSTDQSNAAANAVNLDEAGPYQRWFSQSLLAIDPPDHTRLRSLVSKAFAPRAVEKLQPRIAEIVEDLLDRVENKRRMDVMRDLAYPLPVIVIAEMLGVPAADRDKFKHWSDAIGEGLEPILTPAQTRAADEAILALGDYFRGIIRERRQSPREDLLSALAAAEEQGDHLNEDELLATLILLLAAGNETTTNLIGNGLLALLRNPGELRRLRDEPALMDNAIEELLRFDSPVQLTFRVALQDLEVGGQPVKKGQFCATILGAANHDPAVFPEPETLDIGRANLRHIAFGYGVHFCLGAPLARMESRIAFEILLRRMPYLRLGGRPAWRPTLLLRGLRTLPVTFTKAMARPRPADVRDGVAAGR
ncbi:MAG: cytochrome P450 [Dehalococcoidia bacterium]